MHISTIRAGITPKRRGRARFALTVGSAGLASIVTTPLLSIEEVDKALGRKVAYRPPGQK